MISRALNCSIPLNSVGFICQLLDSLIHGFVEVFSAQTSGSSVLI